MDLEQQIRSECSRLLANCVICYILSELLNRGKSQGNQKQTHHIKLREFGSLIFMGHAIFVNSRRAIILRRWSMGWKR
ncbi:MAG: transposase [Firmicutes bacterium]|nr:transposase [Bacillota bacterium]